MAGATGLEPAASSVTGRRDTSKIKVRFNFLPGKTAPEGLRFDFRERKVDWCVGRSFVASDTLHPAASLTFAASLADQIGATEGDFPTSRISRPTPWEEWIWRRSTELGSRELAAALMRL
jgi:hypothetical protein